MHKAEQNYCSQTCLLRENSEIRGSTLPRFTLIMSMVTDLETKIFKHFKSVTSLNIFVSEADL